VSRRDAPERVRALAGLIRRVAAGEALDVTSGRTLEVPLVARPPIVVAGRADGILRTAGHAADRALLWAVPRSELERSAHVITSAARACRDTDPPHPELIWAPLVDYGGRSRDRVRTIAAYSVLNSRPAAQARWGLEAATLDQLRRLLVSGGAAAAEVLVPPAALDDLIISADPVQVGQVTRAIGTTSLAVPAFGTDEVGERVAWAHEVLRTR
jgi:hypothetical protein